MPNSRERQMGTEKDLTCDASQRGEGRHPSSPQMPLHLSLCVLIWFPGLYFGIKKKKKKAQVLNFNSISLFGESLLPHFIIQLCFALVLQHSISAADF